MGLRGNVRKEESPCDQGLPWLQGWDLNPRPPGYEPIVAVRDHPSTSSYMPSDLHNCDINIDSIRQRPNTFGVVALQMRCKREAFPSSRKGGFDCRNESIEPALPEPRLNQKGSQASARGPFASVSRRGTHSDLAPGLRSPGP